jgi:hypothetical protein
MHGSHLRWFHSLPIGKKAIKKLKRIAIDEICIGKKRYLAVVLDILGGCRPLKGA